MPRFLTNARRLTGRLGGWLRRWLEAALKLGFRLVAAFATLLLLLAFVFGLFAHHPDAKLVATLFVCLLAAAFLAAYGGDIASRVKKIGPVEFLEVQKAVLSLEGIELDLTDVFSDVEDLHFQFIPKELKPAERYRYDEGDRLLSILEYTVSEPKEGSERRLFFELLFNVGRVAHSQLDWLRAIHRLERLEELSAGTHRKVEVESLVAFSKLFKAVFEKPSKAREKALGDAVDRFERLAERRKLSYVGYFWLAYGRDELGDFYEAVQANEEALKRSPRLAPARYNLAISLLNLKRAGEACRYLEEIGPGDRELDRVREGARVDDEMKRLADEVADLSLQSRLRAAVQRLIDLPAAPEPGKPAP